MNVRRLRQKLSRVPFWLFAPILMAGVAMLVQQTDFAERVEQLTLNARVMARAKLAPGKTDNRIVLVAADDAAIEKNGRWPWSRSTHGNFVKALTARPPAVLAWDILFTEAETVEQDSALAGAIAESGIPTVLGAVGLIDKKPQSRSIDEDDGASTPLSPVEGDIAAIPDYNVKLMPLPLFRYVAYSGFVNSDPDSDGIRRELPMVVRFGDNLYPSLVLRILMAYWNVDASEVSVRLGKAIEIPSKGVKIPIDRKGMLHINYRFEIRSYQVASYARLCAGLEALQKGEAYPPNLPDPDGKIVLVGLTATGTSDVGPSALSRLSPLVLVHANALGNILQQDYLKTVPPLWTWLGWILIVGASLAFTRHLPIAIASLAAGALVTIYVLAAFALFIYGNWEISLALPVIGFLMLRGFELGRRILAEQMARREMRSRFSSYLAPAVVEEIIRSGGDPTLGGTRKDVIILFSDIRGFTSIAEVSTVEDLVSQLNHYLTAMVGCVNDHRGTLHKFMGDAIMAVWGDVVDESPQRNATQAVRAALEMRTELEKLNEGWIAEGLPPLKIGVGINFGSVLVGNIGAPQRMEFTVIGDAVNVSQRIESATKNHAVDILVGEGVAALIVGEIATQPVGVIRVKGRQRPLAVHRVLAESASLNDEERQWLERFQAAFHAYIGRRFSEAASLFGSCAEDRPSDAWARSYATRAEEFAKNPPPEGWDGVIEN